MSIAVVAGFFGEEAEWARVEEEWSETLAYWRRLNGDFHLTALTHLVGHEKAPLCARNFASILRKSNLKIIAGVVSIDDFQEIMNPTSDNIILRGPQNFACLQALLTLKQEALTGGRKLPCTVSFDNDYGSKKTTEYIYNYWLLRQGLNEKEFPLAEIRSIPKQCADLAAGAIRMDSLMKLDLLEEEPIYTELIDELMHSTCTSMRYSVWSTKASKRAAEAIKRTIS